MPQSHDPEPPREGPIYEPPPMWAPTPQERRGNYPQGWQLNTPRLFNFRSASGCLYSVLFAMGAVGILITIIARIAALGH